jgi:hypothetical protein
VESSVLVAADPPARTHVTVPHTYDSIEDAAAPLPERLTSVMGLPQFSTKGVDWQKGSPNAPIDWPERLGASN